MHLQKPRPVEQEGIRHTDCPFYDQCLEQAVRNWWDCWSCGSCRNYTFCVVEKRMEFIEQYKGALFQIYPELREKYEQVVSVARYWTNQVSSSE